jgi:putative ATPase
VTDLFDLQRERLLAQRAPLATRMRPRTLDDFTGQEKIVGPGTLLRRLIENDRVPSLISGDHPAPARRPWRGSSPSGRRRTSCRSAR